MDTYSEAHKRETMAREYIAWPTDRREYHIERMTKRLGLDAALRFLDDVAALRQKEKK